MDPDAALAEIRRLLDSIDTNPRHDADFEVGRLIELVRGLDEWLSFGGFRPDAWKIPS